MKLSIITLTLNKLDYTKKFIKSLFEYTKDFELIIVDNGSTDGTVEYLETLDNINFDEKFYPAFFEDNDIKYRAIETGYDVFVNNKVCFFDFGSITSTSHAGNFEQNRTYYYTKHRFAEYLSISGGEKLELQRMTKQFKVFPLKNIYDMYLLTLKIKNRLRKLLGVK